MIQKLALWLCYGLAVFALLVAFGSLFVGAWPVMKFALALTVFFFTAGYLIQPSVEAANNDRDWRDAYKF